MGFKLIREGLAMIDNKRELMAVIDAAKALRDCELRDGMSDDMQQYDYGLVDSIQKLCDALEDYEATNE